MKTLVALLFFLAAIEAIAQDDSPFMTFNQTGRLPEGCVPGYSAGTDTVLYTVPYTYTGVLSIIGSFKNLTWSGNPDDTVTLNGTDNTIGTARTYDSGGAHVVETLTVYNKPAAGSYEEVHTLAPIYIPMANVSIYGDYDGTTATPTCDGAATAFNFTINFCATNATLAAGILHMLHLTDAQTVGVFLGNQNFTSCAAVNSTSIAKTTSSNTTMTPGSPTTAIFTGNAAALSLSIFFASLGGMATVFL